MTGRSPAPSNVIPFRAKPQPVPVCPVDVAMLECGAELVRVEVARGESPSGTFALMADILAKSLHTAAGREGVADLIGRLSRKLTVAQATAGEVPAARRTAARGFRAPDAPDPGPPPRIPVRPPANSPPRRTTKPKARKPSNPGSDAA